MFLPTGPEIEPSCGDEGVGQPAGAARLGPVLPGVELAAGLRRAAWHDDRADVGCLEDAELGAGEVAGQVGELDAEAQVGLVRAEPRHRVGVGHPGQRQRDLVAGDLAPQGRDDRLADADDVLAGDEGHLQVDLGELRLPVLAEVLVAEAAGELVVALKAADHEELLEQLRRLRQGVPVARAQPDGDEEVAGAFRRGPGQVRRLDVHEPVVAHHVATAGTRPWSGRAARGRSPRGGCPGSGT